MDFYIWTPKITGILRERKITILVFYIFSRLKISFVSHINNQILILNTYFIAKHKFNVIYCVIFNGSFTGLPINSQ